MKSPRDRLDAEMVARLSQLTMQAEIAAEGALTGLHKSPHRGASVVFVEHREYRPGDDPRLLDWRAFARSDRPTVKRFEQETQLTATLALDRSSSMAFSGDSARPEKAELGAILLGGLALVLLRQGDRVGGATFADGGAETVSPSAGSHQLDLLLETFLSPSEGQRGTSIAPSLLELLPHSGRRGLFVLASDLLDEDEGALARLRDLRAKGHEVWVLHILDPDELDPPLRGPCRIRGLEGESPIDVPGPGILPAYRRAFGAFRERVARQCAAAGAHYVLAPTDEEPGGILAQMVSRGRTRRGV